MTRITALWNLGKEDVLCLEQQLKEANDSLSEADVAHGEQIRELNELLTAAREVEVTSSLVFNDLLRVPHFQVRFCYIMYS